MSTEHLTTKKPFIARAIRVLSLVIILGWAALALLVTFGVPSLEQVGREHSVPLAPRDAPSVQAMARIGQVFQESKSDSFAMILLEGKQPLGADAHTFYDGLIRELRSDTTHVEHVQDLWGDRLTASGAQSPDGMAAYAQLNLAGDQGTTLSLESIAAIREIVERATPPPGVEVFVTGPAALTTDMQHAGDASIMKMTIISGVIIFVVLLIVYRSIITVLGLLLAVGIELLAARGIVAYLGDNNMLVLSTFAVSLLVALTMAAGTDYGIFFFGRYQEARSAGEDPEMAYYSAFRGTAPVVLGSGLTIAGAMLCLSVTRMPIFQTIAVPCSIGMLVAVAVALTLVPAILAVGGRLGLFNPPRALNAGRWRRIGTAIVRWPGPIFAAALAVSLIGLLALPGYQTSYDDRNYVPADLPSLQGYTAADRHFSQSRMMPEILMIESDHDMRNSTDLLTLHKLAKAIFQIPGISRVQGITRPEGTPIEHSSIPFLISLQNAAQLQNLGYIRTRMEDMRKMSDLMARQIDLTKHLYVLQTQITDITHDSIAKTKDVALIVNEMRAQIADFDDFFRPIRNYLYWEPHCANIPMCFSTRSIFDLMDGVDVMTEKLEALIGSLDKIDAFMPQVLAQLPRMIQTMETMRTMMLTMYSTMSGTLDVMGESTEDANVMGQAFDAAQNDDSFYLPPEVFQNEDFKRALGTFLSPDGKAARFVISHKGNPATPEGLDRIDQIKVAAEEALKTTPLSNAEIWVAGTASTYKDFRDASKWDLLIASVGALCLIFIIMLLITRAFIAAFVIVGTVAISLGASFGLSVLIWQYIAGINLHWMVLPMSVIVLLAVGSDYNLLLVSRMKEELGAGIKTGIIRAMGSTGKVVTNAGLVFAFTMAAMVASDLLIIGQVGTTIALGLLFDTLIVRSFLTPSIAALLGRWFWWPQVVRPRPASFMLRDSAPRPAVRALLHTPWPDDVGTTEETPASRS